MTITTKIMGNAMQLAVCQLGDGQALYAEAGKFLWKTVNVGIETRISTPSQGPGNGGGGGGLLNMAIGAGKRMLAGESLAFQYFTSAGGSGLVSLAGTLPGEMRVIELDGNKGWFAEKDAFVAAESSVNFDIAFSGLRSGMRGGEGFVLEQFTGYGTLLVVDRLTERPVELAFRAALLGGLHLRLALLGHLLGRGLGLQGRFLGLVHESHVSRSLRTGCRSRCFPCRCRCASS